MQLNITTNKYLIFWLEYLQSLGTLKKCCTHSFMFKAICMG